jgi:glutaredoxin
LHDTFAGLNVQVLGISVDHVPCLKAWAESLGGINYPLMSDFWPHGKVAELYGVFRKEGHSERAIFIIDKDGMIRYIDIHDIDEQPDNEVLLNELKKIIPNAEEKVSQLYREDEELPSGGVVMYCTPWCPDCRLARAWLEEHNISYTEVDISVNLNAARQVRFWGEGVQVTPTFEIDGQIILDFDEKKLKAILLKTGKTS